MCLFLCHCTCAVLYVHWLGYHCGSGDSPAILGTTPSCPPDGSPSSPNSRSVSLCNVVAPELLAHWAQHLSKHTHTKKKKTLDEDWRKLGYLHVLLCVCVCDLSVCVEVIRWDLESDFVLCVSLQLLRDKAGFLHQVVCLHYLLPQPPQAVHQHCLPADNIRNEC